MMFYGARAYSLDDIEFLAETDFAFAEIDWKDPQKLRGQMDELAMLGEKYSLAYLAHGPNEGDPSNLESIANLLGPLVCELIGLAPELGITLYTQHLWLDPRFLSAEVIASKLKILESWLECAASASVQLCIENLSEHADHFALAFDCMPGLGLTLDLGHAEILSQPNAAFGFIERFPERIHHVHLHDNRGGQSVRDDLHLPIGKGRINFSGILKSLHATGYDSGFSFEVKLKHVEACRDKIDEIWNAE
jgi:sugar phosphate isomerase/epimerase